MTLFFPDIRGNDPSTHALVIGVGGYRHIEGGVDPRQQVVKQIGVLGQLTSPPRSALAISQFLIDTAQRLRAPLGSVELLVSPAPGDPDPFPPGMNSAPATIANIRQAYAAWRERCARNPDNVAMFYFCGHGVEKVEQYLLAEDFGEDPLNPWLGAFAFDSTRSAFHGCPAKTQCFFIDACRKVPSGLLLVRPTASPLEIVQEDFIECPHDLTMKAAARNTLALGPKNKPSYFSQALIKAFQGAAAEQGPRGWVVTNTGIASNINRILGMVKTSESSPQRCINVTSLNAELARTDGIPSAMLQLTCDSEAARSAAELTCRRASDPPPPMRHQGAPWSLDVRAGSYIAGATFTSGDLSPVDDVEILVRPPLTDFILER